MIFFILLWFSLTCTAATHKVCAACSAPYNSLSSAITSAADGDTLQLVGGETYTGPFSIEDKSLTIEWERYREFCSRGTRVTPSVSALMPKLVATSSDDFIFRAGWDYVELTAVDTSANTLTAGYVGYANNKGIVFGAGFSKNVPAPLVAGVRYYIKNWVAFGTPWQVSATKNGPAIDLTTTGDISGVGRVQVVLANDRRQKVVIKGIRFEGETKYQRVTTGIQLNADYGTILELYHVHVYSNPNDWASLPGSSSGVTFNGASGVVEDSIIETKKVGGDPETTGIAIVNGRDIRIVNNRISATGENIITGGSWALAPAKNIYIANNFLDKPGYFFYSEGSGAPTGNCLYDSKTGTGEFYRRTDVTQNCASGACYICPSNGSWSGVSANTSFPYFRSSRTSNKNLLELKNCEKCLVVGNYMHQVRSTIDTGQGWTAGVSVLCEDAGVAQHATATDILFVSNRAERVFAGWWVRSSTYFGCVHATSPPIRNVGFINNTIVRAVDSWDLGGGTGASMCEKNTTWNPDCSTSNFSIQPAAILQADGAHGMKYKGNTFRGEFRYGVLWNATGRGNMDGYYSVGNLIQVTPTTYITDPSAVYPNKAETATSDCNATTGWGSQGNTLQLNDVYHIPTSVVPSIDFSSGACSAYASGVLYSTTNPNFSATNTVATLQSSSPYSALNPSATRLKPGGGSIGVDESAEVMQTSAAENGRLPVDKLLNFKISRSGTTINVSVANHGTTCTVTLYSSEAKKAADQTGTANATSNGYSTMTFTSQPSSVWWELSCPTLGLSGTSFESI